MLKKRKQNEKAREERLAAAAAARKVRCCPTFEDDVFGAVMYTISFDERLVELVSTVLPSKLTIFRD